MAHPNVRLLFVALFACVGCGEDDVVPPENLVPRIIEATPAEGAENVDPAATQEIRITFSELMDTTAGSLTLHGPGTLGTPAWSDETLIVPISGLVDETIYEVVIKEFVDLTGTPLDRTAYLGEGALDFSTGGDRTPPKAVSSDPNEGQLDVAIDFGTIAVTFDEPMNTSVTDATLEGGTSDVALSGSWDTAGTTLSFALSDPLEYSTSYRIDLTNHTDTAGNALDPAPYLEDGALDFVSIGNPDTQAPFAVSSDPVEGAFNLDPDLQIVSITFSEAMDESITDVPFAEGTLPSSQMVSGVWSDGGTVFTVTFSSFLTAGQGFHLDVSEFRDLAGNALDGVPYLVDGILDFATAYWSGESCNTPLTMSQATVSMGTFTWNIASGDVTLADGQFGCDPNNAGPDVVIRYTKTSDTVANGGMLLHINATGGTDDINLEVTSGYCSAMTGVVEKCLWFKRSWGTFLDVPPGTYWIWVSDDDTAGGFPGATVTVEEIPTTAPQAQGEGCFAPYTTASTNYTPPAVAGDPHVWTIPTTINGYDLNEATGAEGSISCDNHVTYGDLHGVDTVVEFQKAQSGTSLLIEVQNLDPTITQSNLDVEVFDGCDTVDRATISYYCDANKDSFAFTSTPPAGPVYVWIAAEATDDDFNGAEVKITEFSAAPGETPGNPEPLTSSGPISPTSSIGVDKPSCFPTSGNVHWYSYVVSGTLFGVQGDAAAPIAVVDTNGNEIACSTDTTTVAIGSRVAAGETVLVAVQSPTAITNLNLIDQSYTGVTGSITNLGITFPSTAVNEYSMAVGASSVFLGYLTEIWSFPKSGNATAVEHNTGQGLGSAQLGYDIVFEAGRLFSVDSTTTATTSRLFAVYDEGTNAWGPTTWDTPANYPASTAFYSMASDGTSIILAQRSTTASVGVKFFSLPVGAPGTAALLGTNTSIYYVTGVAADASYFYVVTAATGNEALYRISRSNISAPAVRLATLDANITRTNVVVDNVTAANHIYVRDDANVLHVVAIPGGTPIYLGGLLTIGGSADYAMSIDRATNTLYMFDSTLATNGGIAAVQ